MEGAGTVPDSSADHEIPRQQDELTSYPDAVPQPPSNPSPAVPQTPYPNVAGGPAPYPNAGVQSPYPNVAGAPYPAPAAPQPPYPNAAGAPYPAPAAPQPPYPNAAGAPYPSPAAPQPPYQPASGMPNAQAAQAIPGPAGAAPPYPQAGGYPGAHANPLGSPYPAAPGAEAGARPVPQNVLMAFYVMLTGAVVTVLGAAYMLTTIDQIRSDALDASGGVFRGDDLDILVYAGLAGGILTSLVTAGLWVWLGFACRAGKNWARVTGTVFFGINVLFSVVALISTLAAPRADLQSLAFTVVGLVIGLAAVILLWNPKSKAYFAPALPPGYPPYPGPQANGPW